MNCFKVIAHSCSCLGPKVISYCVIRAQVLYEFLLGGSRDGERRWGKEAEKIASQIAAAQTAFAAEIHLCLSLSPLNYMMWLKCWSWWIKVRKSTSYLRQKTISTRHFFFLWQMLHKMCNSIPGLTCILSLRCWDAVIGTFSATENKMMVQNSCYKGLTNFDII